MVSKEVADRVMAVAQTLGYLPNPIASGLRTRRSRTIGVLIPDLTNPVFPPIVRGIARTLAPAGYVVVLADSDSDMLNVKAIVDSLLVRQVDGLILATARREDPIVDECMENAVPLVLVNRTVDNCSVASVTTDDEAGIRLVVQHLVGLGHRRIAFVGGPQTTSTGYARYRAFLTATREAQLPADRRLVMNSKAFSEAAGRMALERIIETAGTDFTAVVTASDLLALGCLDALKEAGLRSPQDVSVTGFNHMPFADRFSPSLTTVHIPHDELGVRAAQLLLERIDNPEIGPHSIRMRPRFVIGASTREIKAALPHGRVHSA